MLPTNHSRTLLAVLALLGLLSSGCAARVYGRSYVSYSAPVVFVAAPQLVYVGPGLYVVRDYDEAVYYSDGYYWCQRGGVWYQTSYWSDPWVTVHVSAVPTTFVHAHHHTYVHYHGAAGAPVYEAPARTYHAASPHAVAAADHRSPPPPAPHGAGAIRRSGPAAHAPASGHMSQTSSSRPVPQPSGAYSGADSRDFRQPAASSRSPGNAQPVSSHRASPPSAAHSRSQPAPAPARSQPAPRQASAPAAPPPSRASAPAARKQPASTPAPSRSKSRKSSDKPSRS